MIFAVVATAALYLYSNLGLVKTKVATVLPFVRKALSAVGADPTHNPFARELVNIAHAHGTGLLVIGITAAAYAVLESVEAVGLWLRKRWAEYLTAVATAGFLPFEIREIVAKVTVIRVGALVINLAILIYLVVAKRLFGVRGGAQAAEHDSKSVAELFGPPGRAPRAEPVAASTEP
jgi:uncharacterized membrane protein (DUF2068 family)